MRKIISFTSILFFVVFSYSIVMAAPPTSSVIVSNAPSQPLPVTAPNPLNVKIFSQPFTLYDSGFVSSPIDYEVGTTGCGKLLACVFNNSIGAANLPVTLNLEFVYPPLAPPACSGTGFVGVSLLTLTVDSLSSNCADLQHGVLPPCLRVATDGLATSYAVILLCQ
jgi:hypothetical protein